MVKSSSSYQIIVKDIAVYATIVNYDRMPVPVALTFRIIHWQSIMIVWIILIIRLRKC